MLFQLHILDYVAVNHFISNQIVIQSKEKVDGSVETATILSRPRNIIVSMLNVMWIEGKLEDGYLFCMLVLLGRWVVSLFSPPSAGPAPSIYLHLSSTALLSLRSQLFHLASYLHFGISVFCILSNFQCEMWPVLLAAVVLALSSAPVSAQDDKCGLNEVRSGSECVCQAG